MLVVVHDWNIQFFFQACFDLETFGSFDIFKVDASESGCDGLYRFDKFVRVFLVHFDIEYVDTCKDLEQQSFPFHHRLAGQRTDIS